jgi:two-component system sensor histidine kinase ChiS
MLLLLFLPLLGLWYAVDIVHTEWIRSRVTQNVRERLSDKADVLAAAINSRISLLYGLKSFVEADPSSARLEKEFSRIATSIAGNADCIRAVQLVQEGRIRYLWPIAGNMRVLGHNLLEDARPSVRRTVGEAMKTDRVVLNGPIELIQGGQGIVGRLRIRDTDGGVWGLAAIVIDIPELFTETGIRGTGKNLFYALRSGDGDIFLGNPSINSLQPEEERIALIGAEWTFLAVPRRGWDVIIAEETRLFRIASGVIAALLTALLFIFVRNRFLLKKLVEHRTSELRQVNEELRLEMAERVKMSDDLATALERAEQSDKLKDTFIASMSHEIRTPLHVIIGYADLLESDSEATAKERTSYMTNIRQAGRRLMRTVEQLLQLSSLRAGTFHINREAIDVDSVIGPLVWEFSAFAADRGLHLDFVPSDGGLRVTADRYCVEQAVANLLDNAIKYTKSGFVRVAVSSDAGTARIVVQDSGIGISEEYRDRMFRPFTQEVSGYARPYDGLGLGLALTHQYIVLNGGSIGIQSEKGKGTSIALIFPTTETTENTENTEKTEKVEIKETSESGERRE